MMTLLTLVAGYALALGAAAPAQGAEPVTPASTEEKKADEKVCRYVALGMDSRRKEKICLTETQWREFRR